MLLFRSIAAGLLGACLYLIADVDRTPLVIERPVTTYVPVPAASPVSVIDVAHGVPTRTLLGLIKLEPDEHVVEVGDQPASNALVAAVLIADRLEAGSNYLDLEIGAKGRDDTRRVLVLMH